MDRKIKILSVVFLAVQIIHSQQNLTKESGRNKIANSVISYEEFTFCTMLFYPYTYPDRVDAYGRSFIYFSSSPSNNSGFQNALLSAISGLHQRYTTFMISNRPSNRLAIRKVVNRVRVYLLIIDNITIIDSTIKSWESRLSWNPLAIVFSILNFAVTPALAKRVFEIFLQNKMVNIYLVYELNNDYKLATWYPYSNGRCADKVDDIIVVGECRPTVFAQVSSISMLLSGKTQDRTQTKKLLNYHRCPLNISASVWEPYVTYNESETDDRKWNGIEVEILRTLAKRLNMSANFILNNESRSDRSANASQGLYSPLLREYVDTFVGI